MSFERNFTVETGSNLKLPALDENSANLFRGLTQENTTMNAAVAKETARAMMAEAAVINSFSEWKQIATCTAGMSDDCVESISMNVTFNGRAQTWSWTPNSPVVTSVGSIIPFGIIYNDGSTNHLFPFFFYHGRTAENSIGIYAPADSKGYTISSVTVTTTNKFKTVTAKGSNSVYSTITGIELVVAKKTAEYTIPAVTISAGTDGVIVPLVLPDGRNANARIYSKTGINVGTYVEITYTGETINSFTCSLTTS